MRDDYQMLLSLVNLRKGFRHKKRGKGDQHKRQKKYYNNVNDEIKAQTQPATDIFLNTHLKNIDSNYKKEASFKVLK